MHDVHLNPALAGVLVAFAFGGRADAGATIVLVALAALAAVLIADAFVTARARLRPARAARPATGGR